MIGHQAKLLLAGVAGLGVRAAHAGVQLAAHEAALQLAGSVDAGHQVLERGALLFLGAAQIPALPADHGH
ncbi:MAG: hypothetical protein A2V99_09140 [Spirochaetes bacterium RBG_16_67_19]|nr:MAG: hypothetical protein A2V99_09140 [Spirochaetes bacterium RBG_16_67_19]